MSIPTLVRLVRAVVGALAILTAGVTLGVGLSPSVGAPSDTLAPSTIVSVTGGARYGFTIHHLGGRTDRPETKSEAMAECGGYRIRHDRARCYGEVSTWYADLADLERTARYYRGLTR
ncbi:MAG: hypothetical protein FWE71_05490 [Nocardioidaceae bacterium]|nr:hypothetical protein [Nocardioidaceae bacterium]MCL2612002.1 hypothetical protein [Nocardioidaceae bacterium]